MINFLIGMLAPGVIISSLKKQDPEKLGIHCADLVDELLNKEFGKKRGEQVQQTIAPFVTKLAISFTKRLIEDAQKEDI